MNKDKFNNILNNIARARSACQCLRLLGDCFSGGSFEATPISKSGCRDRQVLMLQKCGQCASRDETHNCRKLATISTQACNSSRASCQRVRDACDDNDPNTNPVRANACNCKSKKCESASIFDKIMSGGACMDDDGYIAFRNKVRQQRHRDIDNCRTHWDACAETHQDE